MAILNVKENILKFLRLWIQALGLSILALLKAQVSLQFGKVFSSDNEVSVSIMYSYMY